MRPLLAQTLVIFVAVTGLGAASRLNNSATKHAASSVQQHKVKVRRAPHQKQPKDRPYQIGRASWYGKSFHGRKTASGETYNMFQFTAAHPELPLGTYVKVTNLRNSRWVVVRVNDRGPVPQTRIIDLSYGAAQMLGLRAHGIERVRLDLVEPPAMASSQAEVADLSRGGGR
ncbi:MAG TPA: septal ring lytic transglycosylase RlpA family protein [Terriglobales bacterium]|jgi:rare lipoprotein A|nr:septal ring lytic transglycosylase RlpA family protein [Terriglobales bacterium]